MSSKGGSGKRRGTFGGSRLSLSSLLFSSAPKEREKLSRSANDLAEDSSGRRRRAAEGKRLSGEELVEELPEAPSPLGPEQPEDVADAAEMECGLCFERRPSEEFPRLQSCRHRFCAQCWRSYLETEIGESRVKLSCAECPELLHPSDVYALLEGETRLLGKWEEFSLRRTLMAEPDCRFCPAPDCSFAVIATGCAACPEIKCEAPECGATFCYHCKLSWHPSETCDEARAARPSLLPPSVVHDPHEATGSASLRPQDIKACPRCRTYIVKMNDGSCNHMICAICGAEFCWLCLKEISDLHYLSPSGCTFWGKKPWSRKKKLMWQLGTLVGAPVGITLIAGLAVPAIIVGVPVLVGRKVHQKVKKTGGWKAGKRRAAVAGSVAGTFLVSPFLATMAVGVGVPIMLAYVYGVVPLSLCRNGNCGVSASSSGVRLDVDEEVPSAPSPDLPAHASTTSGQESLRLLSSNPGPGSGPSSNTASASASNRHLHVCGLSRGRRPSQESGATTSLTANFEEASTRAIYCDDKSLHTIASLGYAGDGAEDEASTRALAGSVADAKSVCGISLAPGDSVSLRSDSRPPPNPSTALVTVETHGQGSSQRSDRGSPAPLLEEEGSEDESASPVRAEEVVARVAREAGEEGEEGEFLLLSADAYRQLHPEGPPPAKASTRGSASVALLLDNSPGELWQMFSDSVRGRSSADSRQPRGQTRAARLAQRSGGSFSSLPDPSAPSSSHLS